MATTSSLAVPGDPNQGSIRAMLAHRRISKDIQRLQERNTGLAIREEADAADHRRRTGLLVATAEYDADLLIPFVDGVRRQVDGDALRASVVSPLLDDAARMVQTDYRRAFGY